jgi:predicted DsbA family dithiol-disulfide isomerase
MSKVTALGLDEARFLECLTSGRAKKVVEASLTNAIASGLEGVPMVFLNGIRVRGTLDYDNLSRQIQAALRNTTGRDR